MQKQSPWDTIGAAWVQVYVGEPLQTLPNTVSDLGSYCLRFPQASDPTCASHIFNLLLTRTEGDTIKASSNSSQATSLRS